MEAFPGPGEATGDGNATVLAALSDGVSGLVLRVGAGGAPAGDLDRRLEGVFLELVPVVLEAGVDYAAAADAVLALVAALPGGQAGRVVDRLRRRSADGGARRRSPAPRIDVVTELAARLVEYGGGVRAITVDGPVLHNRGASASWELAGALAAGVEYLRVLTDAGLAVGRRRAADQFPVRRR